MRELTMSGVEVTPWAKGVVVNGKYVLAKKLANADSLLHYFENGKGRMAAWGSTVLDGTLADVTTNQYVVILCLGKQAARNRKADDARGEYWAFRLAVLEGDEPAQFEAGKLKVEAIFKG